MSVEDDEHRVKVRSKAVDTRAMDSTAELIEPEAIEPELVAESTVPELASQRRSTPVVASSGPTAERSRRQTLVSPIPALMAASMRVRGEGAEGGPGKGEAVPIPAEPQMTSKQGDLSRALLLDGESDYVVEIDDTRNGAGPAAEAAPREELSEDTDADP